MNKGSRNVASLSARALLEKPGREVPLLGIQDRWKRAQGTGISLWGGPAGEPGRGLIYPGTYVLKRAWETCISLHRGPVENHGGGRGPLTRNSDSWRRALETAHLSLRDLCEGNLEGGLLDWGPWWLCRGRLWIQASLSIGALLGNLEGGSFTRYFERWMKEGSGNGASLSVGALWGEPRGRAPLLGTLKDVLSKALETGDCFYTGPDLGNMWGSSFPRAFERRVKFLLSRDLLWGTRETCNRMNWKWETLSIKAPVGESGRGSFSATFWETDGGLWKWSIYY